jgi:hypothetical protein
MLLIYTDTDQSGPEPDTPEFQAERAGWFALNDALRDAGVLVSGDALEGIDLATTIRVRDGKRLTTDGPFAETKEVLGGYYLLDVPDLDAALEWASKVPNLERGSVEVRPMVNFEQYRP